jgi:hypothetical protein
MIIGRVAPSALIWPACAGHLLPAGEGIREAPSRPLSLWERAGVRACWFDPTASRPNRNIWLAATDRRLARGKLSVSPLLFLSIRYGVADLSAAAADHNAVGSRAPDLFPTMM